MAGEGFQIGFAAGSALAKGVAEWREIQLDRQQRKEFDGAMGLASQRRAMIRSAASVDEAQMLEQIKAQIQRSPDAQQADRPTGNVREDGSPETEQVIRTQEGDIPVQQLLMLKQRKQQAETAAEIAEVDLIMELQARYPENRYVKQWVASTYADIQQKQQLRSKQIEAQRLQLDTILAGEQVRQFDAQLEEKRRQFDAEPERQAAGYKAKADQDIRTDAARISAQKAADLEVEGVKAQNKPPKDETEFVKKLQQMAPRAQQALQQIEALEQSGEEVYDRTGIGAGIETIAPNAARSGKRQQYDQAALQLINSLLRAESGATITEAEIAKAREQYIPRLGETPEVVEQKRQARRVAVENLFSAANLQRPAQGEGAKPRSPEEVRAMFKAKQITLDQAKQMLKTMGR